jgi:hypothetical protein
LLPSLYELTVLGSTFDGVLRGVAGSKPGGGRAEFAHCLHAGLCAAAGQALLLTFDAQAARLPQVEWVGG